MFSTDFLTVPWLVVTLLLIIGFTEICGHVPQTVRLFRQRNSSGLSAVSLGVSFSNYLLWSVYYFDKAFYGLLTVNLIATVIYAVLIAGAVLAGLSMARAAKIAAAYVLGTLSLFFLAPLALPAVLLAGALFMFATACWGAWASESVGGISPLTWLGLLACGLASLGLGILPGREDFAVAAWGTIAAVASTFILSLVWLERRQLVQTIEEQVQAVMAYCGFLEGEHQEECLCA